MCFSLDSESDGVRFQSLSISILVAGSQMLGAGAGRGRFESVNIISTARAIRRPPGCELIYTPLTLFSLQCFGGQDRTLSSLIYYSLDVRGRGESLICFI